MATTSHKLTRRHGGKAPTEKNQTTIGHWPYSCREGSVEFEVQGSIDLPHHHEGIRDCFLVLRSFAWIGRPSGRRRVDFVPSVAVAINGPPIVPVNSDGRRGSPARNQGGGAGARGLPQLSFFSLTPSEIAR
jgi:hypothetical protein